MGYFTWKLCGKNKSMGYGSMESLFLLVPQEFGGKNIKVSYYDGYGDINGSDVYDLVAEWNRNCMSEELIESVNFVPKDLLRAFAISDSEAELHANGNKEWKRYIGIAIACEDKQHKLLKYPIKFYNKDVPYETVAGFSRSTQ